MEFTSKKRKKEEFRVSRTHFLQPTQQPTTDLLIRIILAFWYVLINSIFVLAMPSVIRPFIDDKSTLIFNWISDMIVIEIEVHHTLIEILLSRCISLSDGW